MRMTLITAAVLRAIVDGRRYGFDIVDATGYPTGTIYPALRRLEQEGYVVSHWESVRLASLDGRPARRYYEVTVAGRRALDSALERIQAFGLRAAPKEAR